MKRRTLAALKKIATKLAYAQAHEYDERFTVHCMMGFIGADWDVRDVANAIKSADRVRWIDDALGHNLQVTSGGKEYRFQVKETS